MDEATAQKVREALHKSWSKDTTHIWDTEAHPSYNQCAQTAIVIREKFGGEILKTPGWSDDDRIQWHFYNMMDNQRWDFTSEQFISPSNRHVIEYEDQPLTEEDKKALCANREIQIENLRSAFYENYDDTSMSNRV